MKLRQFTCILVLAIICGLTAACIPLAPAPGRVYTSITRAVTPTPGQLAPLQPISKANANKVRAVRVLKLPAFYYVSVGQCNTTFSPDGSLILAACGKGPVAVWDVQSGQILYTINTNPNQVVTCVFNPDGDTIACGGYNQPITFWDGLTGEKKSDFAWLESPIWDLEFSPDGNSLVSCGIEDSVRLWDVASGIEIWQNEDSAECRSLSFDPQGMTVAFGTNLGKVGLIDASSGKIQEVLIPYGRPAEDVNFDGSGMLLAAASQDNLIHLWRTISYDTEYILKDHFDVVNGVAFNPGSSLLLSNSSDGTSHLWDVAGGTSMKIIGESLGTVLRGEFSPDGKLIATISKQGVVRFYGVPGKTKLPKKSL